MISSSTFSIIFCDMVLSLIILSEVFSCLYQYILSTW
nr:MAG TPA: hypothetical protein [Caudoviricetes sp.]